MRRTISFGALICIWYGAELFSRRVLKIPLHLPISVCQIFEVIIMLVTTSLSKHCAFSTTSRPVQHPRSRLAAACSIVEEQHKPPPESHHYLQQKRNMSATNGRAPAAKAKHSMSFKVPGDQKGKRSDAAGSDLGKGKGKGKERLVEERDDAEEMEGQDVDDLEEEEEGFRWAWTSFGTSAAWHHRPWAGDAQALLNRIE